MKKVMKKFVAMALIMCLFALTACSGGGKNTDFSEVLAGKKWITYHWFINEKDGDNGFFADDAYYNWEFVDANNFTVNALDGSFAGTGTLEWTSENQADVYFVLGDNQEQYWTAEFSYDSTHTDQVHFMIQETNFVYVLEPTE